MHQSVPGQFFQGFDYQYFISGSIRSMTKPGISATQDEVKNISKLPVRSLRIKYEELTANPQRVQELIEFSTGIQMSGLFSDFYKKDIPNDFKRALNSVRAVESVEQPAWTTSGRLERVCRQIQLFPELEQIAIELGYPSVDDVLHRFGISPPLLKVSRGTIVLFHTDDTIYHDEAKRCIQYLEKLNLEYDLTCIPSGEGWVENCAMKPTVLLEARKRLRGPLLYIDVDAIVHKDPWGYLSQYDGDMAVYVHSDGELLSGTIWLNDTVGSIRILERWLENQQKNKKDWDQRVLQAIMENSETCSGEEHFSFQRLPPNFCYVFDKEMSYLFGDIIIEQLQASRAVKNPDGEGTERRRKRIKELSI
jgi:hypothetical protein